MEDLIIKLVYSWICIYKEILKSLIYSWIYIYKEIFKISELIFRVTVTKVINWADILDSCSLCLCSFLTPLSFLTLFFFKNTCLLTRCRKVFHISFSFKSFLSVFHIETLLTHFKPVFHIYIPWKHQKSNGFFIFSGSTEMKHLLFSATGFL